MRVIIVTWGREFFLEIGPQEPVLEIKQKIEHLLGVPVHSQTLAVLGWELIDGLDMDDYPIVKEGTRIDLTIQSNLKPSNLYGGKIQMTVKFSSRRINLEVDRTETVRSLKEKIHILGGVPIKRMSLYFSGRELEDEFCSITEYGIRESSEVVVFLNTLNRQKDKPPTRRLSLVVETSSSLLNAARIPLELKDSCSVSDLKELLLSMKILPPDDYILIHKQRIMRDTCSLQWHGVEDGESLYVFRGTVNRIA
ncbi:uncharacterized protein LOC116204389 [Punica granatum]|uniref:Uncharacterized protein n=2 Tax=Punica granatum TaxID=22663 RepID=A0A2I0IZS2_PUNGR|nr:uncharacterized protein LOC116204389 [Punica granatum]PKI49180.1 hypothetical protein CRG98_030428 [Punica granatum]